MLVLNETFSDHLHVFTSYLTTRVRNPNPIHGRSVAFVDHAGQILTMVKHMDHLTTERP